jgi:hypothetical protein
MYANTIETALLQPFSSAWFKAICIPPFFVTVSSVYVWVMESVHDLSQVFPSRRTPGAKLRDCNQSYWKSTLMLSP